MAALLSPLNRAFIMQVMKRRFVFSWCKEKRELRNVANNKAARKALKFVPYRGRNPYSIEPVSIY